MIIFEFLQYFYAAITYYRRKHYFDDKDPFFLMVGDDFSWNEKNFGNSSDVLVLKPEEDIEDFSFLVNCDELILSASSYSWWAGYLHGGPVVISATVARKNSPLATQINRDYYLPNWLVM